MIGVANRVLQDQGITNLIFSAAIGAAVATVFYQTLYKKTSGLFANQNQVFDYTKFILIAAICLKVMLFLFYFFAVMMIFTVILFADIPNKKKLANYGYVLIIPFLWVIFLAPAL